MTGKFAVSKAGHDKGKLYVVVDSDERYVYLADGADRKASLPKKKNRRHVQDAGMAGEQVLAGIRAGRPDVDDTIRYAIKQRLLLQKKAQ